MYNITVYMFLWVENVIHKDLNVGRFPYQIKNWNYKKIHTTGLRWKKCLLKRVLFLQNHNLFERIIAF